jgi:hypothetical protein
VDQPDPEKVWKNCQIRNSPREFIRKMGRKISLNGFLHAFGQMPARWPTGMTAQGVGLQSILYTLARGPYVAAPKK